MCDGWRFRFRCSIRFEWWPGGWIRRCLPTRGAVHDEHGLLAEPPPGLEGESRPEVGDDPVGRRLRDAEERGELTQGEVGGSVRGHQQHPVLQRQRPRSDLADRIGPLTPQRGDQLVELPRAQPGERAYL